MKSKFIFVLILALVCGTNFAFAQAKKLTKDELVEKSNLLYEGGRQKDALDLIAEYPEFADEVDVLYVKSVALVELREYRAADAVFQRQFDIFLENADASLKIAEEILAKNPVSKEEKEIASFMFATAILSFASADLVNALRAVAMEKNGLPRAKLLPENLNGFEASRLKFTETAVKAGELNLALGQLTDALDDFNRAIELDEKNAAAYAGRARVYRRQKKITLAKADEQKARNFANKK